MDLQRARAETAARLVERRGEIEEAALTRVRAVAPRQAGDRVYAEGLRATIAVAVDYALVALARGEDRASTVPTELLVQARGAARGGISLDTMLRSYFAGFTLFGDFVMREAHESGPMCVSALRRLVQSLSAQFDLLVAAVSEEHVRERRVHFRSPADRRVERVRRLLEGAPVDTSGLPYRFDGWHLGAMAIGPQAAEAFNDLMKPFGRRLLVLCPDGDVTWAWLGGARRVEPAAICDRVAAHWPRDVFLALGEPGHGLAGWRLTHRQAKVALSVVRNEGRLVVCYADVGLIASIMGDDVLNASLRGLYLDPLAGGPDDGTALRETLRAYFGAERNVSSAAAALGISRQTVRTRLKAVEERIGRNLTECGVELEIALRLDDRVEWVSVSEAHA